jgi:hypothetical protein
VVHGPHGDDLHGLELMRAERAGSLLLQTSVRADVNVRLLDARRALLTARDLASGTATDVTWGGLPEPWRTILAWHPEDLERVHADQDGNPAGAPLPVAWDAAGLPLLQATDADQPYLLRLASECVAAAECGAGSSCCAGRCAPEPALESADRDGDDVVLSWAGGCVAGDTVERSANPADFGDATVFEADGGTFRDAGAAAGPATYFYRVH